MRTGKIFVLRAPEISRQSIEIFLDIEGIPDQHMYYLMGVLICDGASRVYHALWADTLTDEERMWHQFLTIVQERPHAPIYHYGSYELQAIAKLGHRYQTDVTNLAKRLVNINAYSNRSAKSKYTLLG